MNVAFRPSGSQPYCCPAAVPGLICKFEDIDGAASTHRALWLLCAQPSIGDCEYDPFLLPAVGAASCRRSSLGPPIGCFGAHFVKLGSSLRQACSSAETGTVSISPARATSISYLVGDAARLRGAIARRNFGIERNSSTRGISTRSRRRSSGKSSDRRRVFSMSWTPVPARVITSRE